MRGDADECRESLQALHLGLGELPSDEARVFALVDPLVLSEREQRLDSMFKGVLKVPQLNDIPESLIDDEHDTLIRESGERFTLEKVDNSNEDFQEDRG